MAYEIEIMKHSVKEFKANKKAFIEKFRKEYIEFLQSETSLNKSIIESLIRDDINEIKSTFEVIFEKV